MGRYIDWVDVVGRYPNIVNQAQEKQTGSYWLEYAEGEVDARLAPKYTVPFTPPAPMVVKDLCIDLTYFKMAIRTPEVEKVWDYLESRFEALIEGTMVLTTSGGPLGAQDLAWATNSYHTSFGPDAPENWRVSSQWIGDVRDERGSIIG